MPKNFEVVNQKQPGVYLLKDNTRIDLRTGMPNSAYAAFKKGFEFLGLLPGAEKLFRKEPVAVVIQLIKAAKRIEDLEVLALVYPKDEEIQKAADAKRGTFK